MCCVCCLLVFGTLSKFVKRNSSEDEIANVNFIYDDIIHALQNTIDWCINCATDRRGYDIVLEHRFNKFRQYVIQTPL